MARKASRIARKIDKKVIKNLGQDTTITRYQSITNDKTGLDLFGEPTLNTDGSDFNNYTNEETKTIRIVVDDNRTQEVNSSMGDIPNQQKERLIFYVSWQEDIQIDDLLIYPAGTKEYYRLERIMPQVFQDQVVVYEVMAYRDQRTNP